MKKKIIIAVGMILLFLLTSIVPVNAEIKTDLKTENTKSEIDDDIYYKWAIVTGKSLLGQWEMKSGTILWHKAPFILNLFALIILGGYIAPQEGSTLNIIYKDSATGEIVSMGLTNNNDNDHPDEYLSSGGTFGYVILGHIFAFSIEGSIEL